MDPSGSRRRRRSDGRRDGDVERALKVLHGGGGVGELVDSEEDGDAAFFSRDLEVSGDTEAVVRLRNALDDVDGSIAEETAAMFGRPGRAILARLRRAYLNDSE